MTYRFPLKLRAASSLSRPPKSRIWRRSGLLSETITNVNPRRPLARFASEKTVATEARTVLLPGPFLGAFLRSKPPKNGPFEAPICSLVLVAYSLITNLLSYYRTEII